MTEALIEKQSFEGWAILELMGHRRLGGYVRQVDMFGASMCRVDVPATGDEPAATQFYSGASIYCLTPTTEETAMRVAEGYRPAPVNHWDLPKPPSLARQA
jgi:hypothetical protein